MCRVCADDPVRANLSLLRDTVMNDNKSENDNDNEKQ